MVFPARQFSDSICIFGKFQICSQFQGARFNQSEPSARRCFGRPRLLLFSCLQLFGIKINRHMILILSKMFHWTTGQSVDQLVKFMWTEQNTFSMTSFKLRFWTIWRQKRLFTILINTHLWWKYSGTKHSWYLIYNFTSSLQLELCLRFLFCFEPTIEIYIFVQLEIYPNKLYWHVATISW